MNEKLITRAEEIIAEKTRDKSTAHCTLAQIDLDGFPTAATITASRAKGIGQIFFCSGLPSNWAKRAQNDNRASICFNSAEYNITLVGILEIVTDPETKKDMWYDAMSNHFSGPEDSQYCVLRFTTQRYSLLVDWQEGRGAL